MLTDSEATRQMTERCSQRHDNPLEKIATVTPIMKTDMLKNASREVLTTTRQAKK